MRCLQRHEITRCRRPTNTHGTHGLWGADVAAHLLRAVRPYTYFSMSQRCVAGRARKDVLLRRRGHRPHVAPTPNAASLGLYACLQVADCSRTSPAGLGVSIVFMEPTIQGVAGESPSLRATSCPSKPLRWARRSSAHTEQTQAQQQEEFHFFTALQLLLLLLPVLALLSSGTASSAAARERTRFSPLPASIKRGGRTCACRLSAVRGRCRYDSCCGVLCGDIR